MNLVWRMSCGSLSWHGTNIGFADIECETINTSDFKCESAMTHSDNGVFLWMTYRVMQEMGLDCEAIYGSVGLADEPPDPNERRDNAFQEHFWRTAERISNDPDIGLHVGKRMPAVRGQVLEYLFLSSPTFGAGLQRAIAYQGLMTDVLQFELKVEGERAQLAGVSHPVRHYVEFALCIVITMLRQVTEDDFQPLKIYLTHFNGAAEKEYQRVWGCPVQLGAAEGMVEFDAALLDRPSPAAEPGLLAVHEKIAQERLEDLQRRDLLWRVESTLGGLLEQGDASLGQVAKQLGLSERQLRAELSQLDTSFNRLLAQYRERLARRLLSRTTEPLQQIVYLTGFSEASAFTRAFKRWTGESPMAYRERKHR
ncbi:transcriptional regulator, AraC family [gamma proteobacterium HTCC5015]|nr:transcriptional regulator, AraC family [gamma proteobacterium HTCC5015]